MQIPDLQDWDLTPADARALQADLAARLRRRPLPAEPRLVAGADMAFDRPTDRAFASVLVLELPGMDVVEEAHVVAPIAFPYVPGLLTFREGPALVRAFRRLNSRPDAVIFDGQGIAHPLRAGLAAHMGLWLGLPTVGCAKSRLLGEHDEPGPRKGQWTPLTDAGQTIGCVLRTRDRVRPVFVSPGHLSDVDSARELVLHCCTRYRLPEPTRLADHAVARLKRRTLQG